MAYTITQVGSYMNIPIQQIFCDTRDDLDNIPVDSTPVGSSAYIISGEEKLFMLNSSKEWIKQ